MNKRKLITATILGMMMTLASVSGYVTVKYVMNQTIEQQVTVGDTVLTEEGLEVTINTVDTNSLTYHILPQTETSKWYITYTYDYEIYLEGYEINVVSLTDDIKINEIVYGETIAITFQLNQDSDFESGDVITIKFLFELVEVITNDINKMTEQQLIEIGFTETEALSVVTYEGTFNNLADVYINVDVFDALTRFEHLVNDGTIVFN